MKHQNLFVLGSIALLIAGAAFYGGMKYQMSVQAAADAARIAARSERGGQGIQGGQGGFGRGGMGGAGGMGGGRFMPTVGKVLSKDDTSLTVELSEGGSRIVILSGETRVTHTEEITLDTVQVGDSVTVMGQPNADGSVTAQRIETGVSIRGNRP